MTTSTTHRRCTCGKTIATTGPDRHYCSFAPALAHPIAVFAHGILCGYAASHVEAEWLADAEIAQQATDQLVADETSCAWADEYEALRDLNARLDYEQEQARAANDPQPVDDGFRAADFRQWNAARMAAHEDAVRDADIDAYYQDRLGAIPGSPAPGQSLLVINAWYGRGEWPVEVIKETPKRYLIRAVQDQTLAPGGRRLACGEEVYVPKAIVRRAA